MKMSSPSYPSAATPPQHATSGGASPSHSSTLVQLLARALASTHRFSHASEEAAVTTEKGNRQAPRAPSWELLCRSDTHCQLGANEAAVVAHVRASQQALLSCLLSVSSEAVSPSLLLPTQPEVEEDFRAVPELDELVAMRFERREPTHPVAPGSLEAVRERPFFSTSEVSTPVPRDASSAPQHHDEERREPQGPFSATFHVASASPASPLSSFATPPPPPSAASPSASFGSSPAAPAMQPPPPPQQHTPTKAEELYYQYTHQPMNARAATQAPAPSILLAAKQKQRERKEREREKQSQEGMQPDRPPPRPRVLMPPELSLLSSSASRPGSAGASPHGQECGAHDGSAETHQGHQQDEEEGADGAGLSQERRQRLAGINLQRLYPSLYRRHADGGARRCRMREGGGRLDSTASDSGRRGAGGKHRSDADGDDPDGGESSADQAPPLRLRGLTAEEEEQALRAWPAVVDQYAQIRASLQAAWHLWQRQRDSLTRSSPPANEKEISRTSKPVPNEQPHGPPEREVARLLSAIKASLYRTAHEFSLDEKEAHDNMSGGAHAAASADAAEAMVFLPSLLRMCLGRDVDGEDVVDEVVGRFTEWLLHDVGADGDGRACNERGAQSATSPFAFGAEAAAAAAEAAERDALPSQTQQPPAAAAAVPRHQRSLPQRRTSHGNEVLHKLEELLLFASNGVAGRAGRANGVGVGAAAFPSPTWERLTRPLQAACASVWGKPLVVGVLRRFHDPDTLSHATAKAPAAAAEEAAEERSTGLRVRLLPAAEVCAMREEGLTSRVASMGASCADELSCQSGGADCYHLLLLEVTGREGAPAEESEDGHADEDWTSNSDAEDEASPPEVSHTRRHRLNATRSSPSQAAANARLCAADVALWQRIVSVSHFIHVAGTQEQIQHAARYVAAAVKQRRQQSGAASTGAMPSPIVSHAADTCASPATAATATMCEMMAQKSVYAFFCSLVGPPPPPPRRGGGAARHKSTRRQLQQHQPQRGARRLKDPSQAQARPAQRTASAPGPAASSSLSQSTRSRVLPPPPPSPAHAPPAHRAASSPAKSFFSAPGQGLLAFIKAARGSVPGAAPPTAASPPSPPATPPAAHDAEDGQNAAARRRTHRTAVSPADGITAWLYRRLIPLFLEVLPSDAPSSTASSETSGVKKIVLVCRVQHIPAEMFVTSPAARDATSTRVYMSPSVNLPVSMMIPWREEELLLYLLSQQLFFREAFLDASVAPSSVSSATDDEDTGVREKEEEEEIGASNGEATPLLQHRQQPQGSAGPLTTTAYVASPRQRSSSHSPLTPRRVSFAETAVNAHAGSLAAAHGRTTTSFQDSLAPPPPPHSPSRDGGMPASSPLGREPASPSIPLDLLEGSRTSSPRSILKSGKRYKRAKLIRDSAAAASVVPHPTLMQWRWRMAEDEAKAAAPLCTGRFEPTPLSPSSSALHSPPSTGCAPAFAVTAECYVRNARHAAVLLACEVSALGVLGIVAAETTNCAKVTEPAAEALPRQQQRQDGEPEEEAEEEGDAEDGALVGNAPAAEDARRPVANVFHVLQQQVRSPLAPSQGADVKGTQPSLGETAPRRCMAPPTRPAPITGIAKVAAVSRSSAGFGRQDVRRWASAMATASVHAALVPFEPFLPASPAPALLPSPSFAVLGPTLRERTPISSFASVDTDDDREEGSAANRSTALFGPMMHSAVVPADGGGSRTGWPTGLPFPNVSAAAQQRLRSVQSACLVEVQMEIHVALNPFVDRVLKRLSTALAEEKLRVLCEPLVSFLESDVYRAAAAAGAEGSAEAARRLANARLAELCDKLVFSNSTCLLLPHVEFAESAAQGQATGQTECDGERVSTHDTHHVCTESTDATLPSLQRRRVTRAMSMTVPNFLAVPRVREGDTTGDGGFQPLGYAQASFRLPRQCEHTDSLRPTNITTASTIDVKDRAQATSSLASHPRVRAGDADGATLLPFPDRRRTLEEVFDSFRLSSDRPQWQRCPGAAFPLFGHGGSDAEGTPHRRRQRSSETDANASADKEQEEGDGPPPSSGPDSSPVSMNLIGVLSRNPEERSGNHMADDDDDDDDDGVADGLFDLSSILDALTATVAGGSGGGARGYGTATGCRHVRMDEAAAPAVGEDSSLFGSPRRTPHEPSAKKSTAKKSGHDGGRREESSPGSASLKERTQRPREVAARASAAAPENAEADDDDDDGNDNVLRRRRRSSLQRPLPSRWAGGRTSFLMAGPASPKTRFHTSRSFFRLPAALLASPPSIELLPIPQSPDRYSQFSWGGTDVQSPTAPASLSVAVFDHAFTILTFSRSTSSWGGLTGGRAGGHAGGAIKFSSSFSSSRLRGRSPSKSHMAASSLWPEERDEKLTPLSLHLSPAPSSPQQAARSAVAPAAPAEAERPAQRRRQVADVRESALVARWAAEAKQSLFAQLFSTWILPHWLVITAPATGTTHPAAPPSEKDGESVGAAAENACEEETRREDPPAAPPATEGTPLLPTGMHDHHNAASPSQLPQPEARAEERAEDAAHDRRQLAALRLAVEEARDQLETLVRLCEALAGKAEPPAPSPSSASNPTSPPTPSAKAVAATASTTHDTTDRFFLSAVPLVKGSSDLDTCEDSHEGAGLPPTRHVQQRQALAGDAAPASPDLSAREAAATPTATAATAAAQALGAASLINPCSPVNPSTEGPQSSRPTSRRVSFSEPLVFTHVSSPWSGAGEQRMAEQALQLARCILDSLGRLAEGEDTTDGPIRFPRGRRRTAAHVPGVPAASRGAPRKRLRGETNGQDGRDVPHNDGRGAPDVGWVSSFPPSDNDSSSLSRGFRGSRCATPPSDEYKSARRAREGQEMTSPAGSERYAPLNPAYSHSMVGNLTFPSVSNAASRLGDSSKSGGVWSWRQHASASSLLLLGRRRRDGNGHARHRPPSPSQGIDGPASPPRPPFGGLENLFAAHDSPLSPQRSPFLSRSAAATPAGGAAAPGGGDNASAPPSRLNASPLSCSREADSRHQPRGDREGEGSSSGGHTILTPLEAFLEPAQPSSLSQQPHTESLPTALPTFDPERSWPAGRSGPGSGMDTCRPAAVPVRHVDAQTQTTPPDRRELLDASEARLEAGPPPPPSMPSRPHDGGAGAEVCLSSSSDSPKLSPPESSKVGSREESADGDEGWGLEPHRRRSSGDVKAINRPSLCKGVDDGRGSRVATPRAESAVDGHDSDVVDPGEGEDTRTDSTHPTGPLLHTSRPADFLSHARDGPASRGSRSVGTDPHQCEHVASFGASTSGSTAHTTTTQTFLPSGLPTGSVTRGRPASSQAGHEGPVAPAPPPPTAISTGDANGEPLQEVKRSDADDEEEEAERLVVEEAQETWLPSPVPRRQQAGGADDGSGGGVRASPLSTRNGTSPLPAPRTSRGIAAELEREADAPRYLPLLQTPDKSQAAVTAIADLQSRLSHSGKKSRWLATRLEETDDNLRAAEAELQDMQARVAELTSLLQQAHEDRGNARDAHVRQEPEAEEGRDPAREPTHVQEGAGDVADDVDDDVPPPLAPPATFPTGGTGGPAAQDPLTRMSELEKDLANARFQMAQWQSLVEAERRKHAVQLGQLQQQLQQAARVSRSPSSQPLDGGPSRRSPSPEQRALVALLEARAAELEAALRAAEEERETARQEARRAKAASATAALAHEAALGQLREDLARAREQRQDMEEELALKEREAEQAREAYARLARDAKESAEARQLRDEHARAARAAAEAEARRQRDTDVASREEQHQQRLEALQQAHAAEVDRLQTALQAQETRAADLQASLAQSRERQETDAHAQRQLSDNEANKAKEAAAVALQQVNGRLAQLEVALAAATTAAAEERQRADAATTHISSLREQLAALQEERDEKQKATGVVEAATPTDVHSSEAMRAAQRQQQHLAQEAQERLRDALAAQEKALTEAHERRLDDEVRRESREAATQATARAEADVQARVTREVQRERERLAVEHENADARQSAAIESHNYRLVRYLHSWRLVHEAAMEGLLHNFSESVLLLSLGAAAAAAAAHEHEQEHGQRNRITSDALGKQWVAERPHAASLRGEDAVKSAGSPPAKLLVSHTPPEDGGDVAGSWGAHDHPASPKASPEQEKKTDRRTRGGEERSLPSLPSPASTAARATGGAHSRHERRGGRGAPPSQAAGDKVKEDDPSLETDGEADDPLALQFELNQKKRQVAALQEHVKQLEEARRRDGQTVERYKELLRAQRELSSASPASPRPSSPAFRATGGDDIALPPQRHSQRSQPTSRASDAAAGAPTPVETYRQRYAAFQTGLKK